MTKTLVRDMPTTDQPRYRMSTKGPQAMSTVELLQLITRSHHFEPNYALLTEAGSLTNLADMTAEEVAAVDGIGEGSAASIKAAFELGRRLAREASPEALRVGSPSDAAVMLLNEYSHLEQEHFFVILLDTRNKVIDVIDLYTGSINATHIRVAEVFRDAIRRNAAAVVVGHNHPSGDPEPSPEDCRVNERIREAGELLGIELLDHIVFGKTRFFSLRERGLGGF